MCRYNTFRFVVVGSLCAVVDSMEVTIPQVDDFHHHFRDGEVLKDTVRHASRMFRRAVSYIKHATSIVAACLWNHTTYGAYVIHGMTYGTNEAFLCVRLSTVRCMCVFVIPAPRSHLETCLPRDGWWLPCWQIAMPNLKPPVTTTDQALEYRQVSGALLVLAKRLYWMLRV